jgi:oxygen-independent coproporphyrinogen-3 oxidase
MHDAKTKQADRLDIGQISDNFLEKYNRPGPRYTSYPTAPVLNDEFGPAAFDKYFQRAENRANTIFSAIHLPF